MKNIFKSLFVPALLLAVAPFFASCSEDRDDNPTLRQPTGNLTMTAPAGSETTTYDLLNTSSLTVSTTAPDYGFSSVILYQLQVSLNQDFTTSRTLTNVNETFPSSTKQPEITFNCRELNDSIVSLYQEVNNGNNPSEDPMTVYIRVQASVNGSNMDYVYSSPVSLSVIAQFVENTPSLYYLVGALYNNWAVNTNCIFYPTSTTVYSYTTQWTGAGNLKFWLDSEVGTWTAAYGCATDGDNSPSGTLVKSVEGAEAGAIVVPTIGEYYTFTADMENMTYTWTRLENQSPSSYPQMSVRGDFNSWNFDTFMSEVAPHNWYINITFSSDTQFKFCADSGWSSNWGGAKADGSAAGDNEINIGDQFWGAAASGGGNMMVPAGTYDIYFNDITREYVFVIAE